MNAATIVVPARSSNTVVMSIITHDKDGGEKNRWAITERGAVKALVIFAALFFAGSVVPSELTRWEKRSKTAALRPQMEVLANAGKDDAAMWLAVHYLPGNEQRLAGLVEKKYPEAMFMQGWLIVHDIHGGTDKGGGWHLMKQAAALGSASAIEYLENNNKQ